VGRLTKAEKLRQEQVSPKWRDAVFKFKGRKCAVCGKKEDLEIHHVLPIIKGGTNDFNNLLVVCQEHHTQLHGKIYRNKINFGRKKIVTYEEALPVLHQYFNLEIGHKECSEILGYSPTSHNSALMEYKKRYRKENNVPRFFYNNIDLKVSKAR
jgi:hypothetical protein